MLNKFSLKNGLKVLSIPSKDTQSVTILVLVGVGSKYEIKKINGISHFLEHMFFKGTKKRPTPLKISQTLDNVGGIYNAFTSKEYTGFFAKVQKNHFELALDWVSDILLHSLFQSKSIEKERGVIIEELNMYLDTPMQYINDLWEKLLYGNQPAGWSIIGEKDNILRFKRKDFLKYLKGHYSSLNSILAVSGNFPEQKLKRKAEHYFKILNPVSPNQKIKVIEDQSKPESLIFFKQTDQTHLCLGVRGYSLFSKEKYAQKILATILGGNMSSRLFKEIREERGLAYYVRTSEETTTDTGYLVTQAGVPHNNVEKVIGIILKEYKKIREKGVSKLELERAKEYLKGTLSLTLEPSDAQASFYSTQELLRGKILTLPEYFSELDKVSLKDIQKLARDIFLPAKLNLALIGPFKDKSNFDKLLKNSRNF